MNSFDFSGAELVESNKRIEDFTLIARGSKSTTEDEIDETEAYKTEQYVENLKDMLNLERVTMSNKISRGIYEQEKNRVKVTVHFGKWNVGYHEDNVNYLKPYEALQLIEMRRLEVTFDSVIMSIEQAYEIFLNPDNNVSFEEYLTYSYLVRAGYFVEEHNFESDSQKFELLSRKQLAKNEDEMIWFVLMEKLNMPVAKELRVNEPEIYENAKKTLANLCEQISGKREHEDSSRLTEDVEPAAKRMKPNGDEVEEQNFLDILKTEAEYASYQEVLRKFNFIKRTPTFDEPQRKLKISFDVHMPKNNFKRTEDLASYRVVVIK